MEIEGTKVISDSPGTVNVKGQYFGIVIFIIYCSHKFLNSQTPNQPNNNIW